MEIKDSARLLIALAIILMLSFVIVPTSLYAQDDDDSEDESISLKWGYTVGFIEENGGVSFDSYGMDIQIDDDGNFFVLAEESENGAMEIMKLNSERVPQWNHRFINSYELTDYNRSFKLPPKGNETSETTLWVNFTWAGEQERWVGRQMAVGAQGDPFVTATYYHYIFNDPQFDSNGTVSFENDTAVNRSTSKDVLLKIGENGTILWELVLDDFEHLPNLLAEFDGTVSVYGQTKKTNTSASRSLIQMISSDGAVIGEQRPMFAENQVLSELIHIDESSRLLAGTFSDSDDVWVWETGDDYKQKMSAVSKAPIDGIRTNINSIHISENGEYFLSSGLVDSGGGQVLWLVRLDKSGTGIWSKTYESLKNSTVVNGMVWTEADELSCFGTYRMSDGEGEMLFFKLDSSGELISQIELTNKNEHDTALGMEYLENGTYLLLSGGDEIHIMMTHPDPVFDSDHDGWYDPFEWRTFETLAETPDSDADGDGFTNQEELDEGTSPTNDYDYPGQELPVYIILAIVGLVLFVLLIIISKLFLMGRSEKKKDQTDEPADDEK